MPIYYLDSGSVDNLTVSNLSAINPINANANLSVAAGGVTSNLSQLVLSNSNNVSFGLNASTVTAAANFNVSAGTTSNNFSQLVFSNANGISFGLNSNTITATINPSAAALESYYYNLPVFQGSSNTLTLGGSSNFVQPFLLPYDVSMGYLRVLLSNSFGSTTFASTANTSIAFQQTQTWFANLYSQGSGANSRTIQQFAGSSASMVLRIAFSLGPNTNQQTVSYALTYPVTGSYGNYNTTYNPGASINISTTQLTQFNAGRYLDIPFATSLAAGNYWVAFQRSSATATTAGTQFTGCTHANSYYYATQINASFAEYGNASNASTNPIYLFNGYWSTNTNGATTVSIAQSLVSSIASNPIVPFQLINQA